MSEMRQMGRWLLKDDGTMVTGEGHGLPFPLKHSQRDSIFEELLVVTKKKPHFQGCLEVPTDEG